MADRHSLPADHLGRTTFNQYFVEATVTYAVPAAWAKPFTRTQCILLLKIGLVINQLPRTPVGRGERLALLVLGQPPPQIRREPDLKPIIRIRLQHIHVKHKDAVLRSRGAKRFTRQIAWRVARFTRTQHLRSDRVARCALYATDRVARGALYANSTSSPRSVTHPTDCAPRSPASASRETISVWETEIGISPTAKGPTGPRHRAAAEPIDLRRRHIRMPEQLLHRRKAAWRPRRYTRSGYHIHSPTNASPA